MLYSFTNFTIKDNCMRDYLADTLDQTRKGSIWSLGLKFYPAFMPVYRTFTECSCRYSIVQTFFNRFRGRGDKQKSAWWHLR
jgi:hypothetical protein